MAEGFQAFGFIASRTLSLRGDIRADAGLLAQIETGKPRWSDDVKLSGQSEVKKGEPAYDIDAGFDLGEHFYVRTAGLESRLSGRLRLQGEAGSPMRATGIIATQDGLFNAYGQRLTVAFFEKHGRVPGSPPPLPSKRPAPRRATAAATGR